MEKKNTAPHRYMILWLPLFLIGLGLLISAECGHAGILNELSDVQNGIFHLSPRNYEFSAETDKADQYIDDEQADFFISAAKPNMDLEADGNYPFSVVDHQIHDSDLEIRVNSDGVCHPYPSGALYLSRDNILEKEYNNRMRPPNFFVDNSRKTKYRQKFEKTHFEKEYNDRLNPPDFFSDSHYKQDPFNHRRVKTLYMQFHDYEVTNNEALHRSVTPGEDCIAGYMLGGYVLSRGYVNVWVGETFSKASYKPPEIKKPKYTGRCDGCNN